MPLDLSTPEKRMAFLKANDVDGYYLISGAELLKIQEGTSKGQAELRNWRVLAQALWGITTPEQALEFAQRQKIHRQGIFDDRMRFRNALLQFLAMKGVEPYVRAIAHNALNPPVKPEKKE